ncbi:hypothetical protein F0562_032281 [Nyssa sinensis]|uniref:Uncharacterized protein n=1 Tax=Nyssa sinensis TaxID=561372 RepID=A0A5J5APX7_9ASTE|nr:hypothetical protein F0562_032281 [Nyssa sinensis]
MWGGNTSGVKGEQPLGTMVNQGGGTNIVAATKGAFSDLRGGSKGLSPTAVEGSVGLVNTVDIGAECVANPLSKSWGQVVNTNVQHKGFTLEFVAPCVKNDKVVVQHPLEPWRTWRWKEWCSGGAWDPNQQALFLPRYLWQRGLSLQDQNGDFPLGNSETHGGDGRPTLEKQKGENSGTIPLVRPALCCKKGLTKKVTSDQYPMGTSGTYERAGGPSQDKQKVDGTATSSSDLGGNRGVANGDQLVGNVIN